MRPRPSRARARVAAALVVGLLAGGCAGEDGGRPAPARTLTVAELVDGGYTGQVAVRGFLIDSGGGPRLCEAVLESYPPQCGEPSIRVEGVTVADLAAATTDGGTSWVEQADLVGDVAAGVLTVTPR